MNASAYSIDMRDTETMMNDRYTTATAPYEAADPCHQHHASGTMPHRLDALIAGMHRAGKEAHVAWARASSIY
jgi:hypothetical protein